MVIVNCFDSKLFEEAKHFSLKTTLTYTILEYGNAIRKHLDHAGSHSGKNLVVLVLIEYFELYQISHDSTTITKVSKCIKKQKFTCAMSSILVLNLNDTILIMVAKGSGEVVGVSSLNCSKNICYED